MKVYLAADHTGFETKERIKEILQNGNYQIEDCGAFEFDKDDDYPDFISKAAEKVSIDPEQAVGIVIGGSGQGEAMTANKFPNVRCALFYAQAEAVRAVDITGRESHDPFEILRLTRDHNHANMLSIGIRFLTDEDVLRAVKVWLESNWSNQERHIRRVEKIIQIEKSL